MKSANSSKKILVIGGAGYIGSHVCLAFLEAGYSVTVFDNLSTGREINLFPEADFIRGDILHPEELSNAMKSGFHGVVHLAALKAAGESMLEPEKYSRNNITGTLNILAAVTEALVPCFVFSSSAAVYGSPEYLPIDEKHPTRPENYYGFTKLEIERFLDWYSRLRGIHYAALRYFNAAGYDPEGRILGLEQKPANLLPVVMEAAVGVRESLQIFGNDYKTRDGTGVRDYVHVNDLAEAHLKALEYIEGQQKNLTVNLGSETGLSVMEIVEAARKITGKEIPAKIVGRRPGDPAELIASSSRARELLGWEARHSSPDILISSMWKVYTRQ